MEQYQCHSKKSYFLKDDSTNSALNAAGTAADTKTDTCGTFGVNGVSLVAETGAIIGSKDKLCDALNAGATKFNDDNKLLPNTIQASEWVEVVGSYPKHKPIEIIPDPTPEPTLGWTYPTSSTISTKPFAVGEGTVDAPFEISTAQELANMSYLINTANTTYNGKDVHYKLTANIELNDTANWVEWGTTATGVKAWTPIGVAANQFKGAFDGNGKTVSGIYINGDVDYRGLFGAIASTATVQNVGVIKSYIKGRNSVGGVVGYNFGAITNCYNLGSVNGTVDNTGGVVGQNNSGSLNNCYNDGVVSGSNYTGGVVGQNNSGVTINCHNDGVVSGVDNVGGVAGSSNGIIANCYNRGVVEGTTGVGGIIGYTMSSIINCYNTGNVKSTGTKFGGVVGWNNSNAVKNCYFLKTTGTNETLNAAGTATTTTSCGYFTDNGETLTAEAGEIIGKNKKLLDALNAGVPEYNKTEPGIATPAMAWAADTEPGGYPKHTTGSVTPPDPEPTKPFAKGDGSVGSPYEISTAQDLIKLSELINAADATYSVAGVHYKLTADIKLNGDTIITSASTDATPWTPIGDYSNPFLGVFDGQGFTVSGIYIKSNAGNQSLFGVVGNQNSHTATVKNVGVINSYIEGNGNTGGIVGNNYGAVINCYYIGAVAGSQAVGGVAGQNWGGKVINCYNTGAVTGTSYIIGGVVGKNVTYGTVINCYNHGDVKGSSEVGGVIGQNLNGGEANNCYNSGKVTGTDSPQRSIGGVVGENSTGGVVGKVNNCYFLQTTDINDGKNVTGTVASSVTSSAIFDADEKLTPEITIEGKKCATLFDALTAGKDEYNKTEAGVANPAVEWVVVESNYPTLKMVKKPTPPTPPAGGGDSDSEPSISPEDIFWTRVITDLKLKDEPVVEFNCKYPRMSRRVLLALQEVDKTLNINLNGEKISLTSKQVKPLTFDKASYSVAELKALLEVKPEVTPTPTPTPTEKPTEPVVPETPTANLTWLWILLAVVAVGAVVAFVVIKRKKK